jgi:hypothetical protein
MKMQITCSKRFIVWTLVFPPFIPHERRHKMIIITIMCAQVGCTGFDDFWRHVYPYPLFLCWVGECRTCTEKRERERERSAFAFTLEQNMKTKKKDWEPEAKNRSCKTHCQSTEFNRVFGWKSLIALRKRKATGFWPPTKYIMVFHMALSASSL